MNGECGRAGGQDTIASEWSDLDLSGFEERMRVGYLLAGLILTLGMEFIGGLG